VAAGRSGYLPKIWLDAGGEVSNAPTRVFMMKLDQGRFTSDDFLIPNLNHPKSHGNFRTGVELEQPLFDLRIGHNVDLARQGADMEQFLLVSRREETAFRVYASCLDIQRAKARLSVTERAIADAREHLRLATLRNETGVGLKSDELRARTFLAEREQEAITAQNDVAIARMRLSLTTGGEAGNPIDISEPLPQPVLDKSKETLVSEGLANRTDLKIAQKGVARAATREKLAGSEFFPTAYASASYRMNDRDLPFGRDNDAWQAGVGLKWELFDGMRRWNGREQARAMKNSAEEELQSVRQEVAFQVDEALLRRSEAEKKLEVARQGVRYAEESTRLIARRFENSLSTMVELLDAQTALDNGRASLVESEAGYALATARVYYAAGEFLQEVLK